MSTYVSSKKLKKKLNNLNKLKAKKAKVVKEEKESEYESDDAEQAETVNENISEDMVLPGTDMLLSDKFEDLKVSEPIKKAISEMGFSKMTEIQKNALPPGLEFRDVVASAKTGSGKTIAFLVPIVEIVLKLGLQPHNGTGAIIISPTREELIQFTSIRTGLIMGGSNRQAEAQNLEKGVAILVATPGRLLDHLTNSQNFLVHNLKALVIDEADRMLDIGFEQEMRQILRLLPKNRQTMLFSATLNDKTKALAKDALKSDCAVVGIEKQACATVDGLEQGYVVCPPEKRFCLLYTFLKKNKGKKIMVFMSSCMEVKFYYELLNFIDMPVLAIHGKQKQAKRTTTFLRFCKEEEAVLVCTDVGARGLDIPKVDWILQYDPPDCPKEYIHRVGRTARGGELGKALLVLRPHEMEFLTILRKSRVKVVEYEISAAKMVDVQPALEKLVSTNYFLASSAQEAFKGLVRAYASFSLSCFSIADLDLAAAAKTCGLTVVPRVDLAVHAAKGPNAGSKRYKPVGMSDKKAKKAMIYKKIR